MAIDPKRTAQLLRDVVGGSPRVQQFYNDNESESVAVFIAQDRPQDGVTTYATVNASRFDTNIQTADGRLIRVEFITQIQSNFDAMANVIANCALNIADGKYQVRPDMVLPNVISAADPSVQMKHCLVGVPVSWERLPNTVDEGDAVLAFLQLVPITDSELEFAYERGVPALSQRLAEANADILHIEREAVA